jgi:hypothetical protein
LWGTTSFIADEVVALRDSYDKLLREMGSADHQVIADQIDKVAFEGAELQKRFATVVEVVSSMMAKVQTITPAIEEIKGELGRLSSKQRAEDIPPCSAVDEFFHMHRGRNSGDKPPARATGQSHVQGGSSEWKMDPDFAQLIADVNALKLTVNDSSAIKFAGLGLRDVKDAIKWVEKNFSQLRYGLIMDPLLMLERIYGDDKVDSGSFLKSMERHD